MRSYQEENANEFVLVCLSCCNTLNSTTADYFVIVRALIRNPKILLLDEVTSALDIKSEKLVHNALKRAQDGRTCICISHRLSTIENASKICVFKEGKIFEEGSHETLWKNCQIYYTLKARDMLGKGGNQLSKNNAVNNH